MPAMEQGNLLTPPSGQAVEHTGVKPQLGPRQWTILHEVFQRLVLDGCDEVSTNHLLSTVRTDREVLQHKLLDYLVPFQGQGRATSLFQALEYVEAQLETLVTWSRFHEIILQAPSCRRPSLQELMTEAKSRIAPHGRQSSDQGDASIVTSCGALSHEIAEKAGSEEVNRARTYAGTPSEVNKHPERANRWFVLELGINSDMLKRFHERFVYCQRGNHTTHAVRRMDLVASIQSCHKLAPDLSNTLLLNPGERCERKASALPRTWGDVFLDLNRHEFDLLSWADVLDVIRWNWDIQVGNVRPDAVGPGGLRPCQRPDYPGPAVANGPSRDKLIKLITGTEAHTTEGSSSSMASAPQSMPFMQAEPSHTVNSHAPHFGHNAAPAAPPEATTFVPPLAKQDTTSALDSDSPFAAAEAAFARCVHGMKSSSTAGHPLKPTATQSTESRSRGRHRHILLDNGSDDEERERAGIISKAPTFGKDALEGCASWTTAGPALQQMSGHKSYTQHAGRQASVRVRLSTDYEEWYNSGEPVEQMEEAVARILNLPVSAVKLKRIRP